MKRIFFEISMYVSSFIPLYFLIITKELLEIANGNLTFNITNSVMLSFNFLLMVVGVVGVFFMLKRSNFNEVEILTYRNITCENFFPYFPLFVLFALAFELEFISMAVVYVLILVMVGIVYIKNRLFYINPFLNIIGFNSYEVSFRQGEKVVENKKLFAFKKIEKGKIYVSDMHIKSVK